jgi:hypothetical protein
MKTSDEPRYVNLAAHDVHVPLETGGMRLVKPFSNRARWEEKDWLCTGEYYAKFVGLNGPLFPFPGEDKSAEEDVVSGTAQVDTGEESGAGDAEGSTSEDEGDGAGDGGTTGDDASEDEGEEAEENGEGGTTAGAGTSEGEDGKAERVPLDTYRAKKLKALIASESGNIQFEDNDVIECAVYVKAKFQGRPTSLSEKLQPLQAALDLIADGQSSKPTKLSPPKHVFRKRK